MFQSRKCTAVILLVFCVVTGAWSYRPTRDVTQTPVLEDILDLVGGRRAADLVLVLDRSTSMSSARFYTRILELTYSILKYHVTVHPDYVRLGAITFGKDSTVMFDHISRSPYLNKAELLVDTVNTPSKFSLLQYNFSRITAAGSNLNASLHQAYRMLEKGQQNRPGASQIVLLMTDGNYLPYQDPYPMAQLLRKQLKVVMFSVSVGSWLRTGNVRTMASMDAYHSDFDRWRQMVHEQALLRANNLSPLWLMVSNEYCNTTENKDGVCYCDTDRGISQMMCGQGEERTSGGKCQKCPTNSFKTKIGNAKCSACPPGTRSARSGSTKRRQCVCETRRCQDACKGDPCGVDNDCTEMEGGGFTCDCAAGHENEFCPSWDNCAGITCDNGGTCIDGRGTFTCLCPYGYRGRLCEQDLNECRVYNLCDNGGTCVEQSEKDGTFKCECVYGFSGKQCTGTCTRCSQSPNTTTTASGTVTTTLPPQTASHSSVTTIEAEQELTTTDKIQRKMINNDMVNSKLPDKSDPLGEDAGSQRAVSDVLIAGTTAGGVVLVLLVVVVVFGVATACGNRKQRNNSPRDIETADSVANKFSGLWRTKTIRSSENIYSSVGPKKSLPTAPPKRRPVVTAAVESMNAINVVEESMFSDQSINENESLEMWQVYMDDVIVNTSVEAMCIFRMTDSCGKQQYVATDNWVLVDDEMVKLWHILCSRDKDIPARVQGGEYHIQFNGGFLATGKTISSSEAPKQLAIGCSKVFLVVSIGDGSQRDDRVSKEVEWVCDHLANEGY